jgi:drug/metabolite transporter (DMT)-like permease
VTRVGISVCVNPIVASLVGASLLGEPLRLSLGAGIVAVFIGIALASRPDSVVELEPRLQRMSFGFSVMAGLDPGLDLGIYSLGSISKQSAPFA